MRVWRKPLNGICDQHYRLSVSTTGLIIERFYPLGQVEDQKADKYSSNGCSVENIDFIRASVVDERKLSIGRTTTTSSIW